VDDALVVVVGPTASGKTELAVRLCEWLDGEVIGADSVQVYREFDVGSGKPSVAELQRARHHLVSVAGPLDPMDASVWAKLADGAIADVRARGKRPIVCGGTFLWIKALLWGLAEAPPADAEIRRRHAELVDREGREALHRKLGEVDTASAARLAPNDFVRVSRALEVFELTGVPLEEWQDRHGFRDARYPGVLVGVEQPREVLDRRIEARVRAMLANGWIEEVAGLLARGYGSARAMRSVGYRQVAEAIATETADPDRLWEPIYRATRGFVRRQRTWLRDQPVRWITPEHAQALRREDLAKLLFRA
jgi:tRNA dimethylallyltransferase